MTEPQTAVAPHVHRCPDCAIDAPCLVGTCKIHPEHSEAAVTMGRPFYCNPCWAKRQAEKPDPNNYDFVTDRLAVGAVASRVIPGFVAVVSVLATKPWDEQYGAPAVPDGVPVHMIDLMDGERGLEAHLDGAVAFIAEHIAKGCVLVHCAAGMSRSVSVVAAYLCRYAGMRLDQAVDMIKERRQGACPADIFWAAITQWLRLDLLSRGGPRKQTDHQWEIAQ